MYFKQLIAVALSLLNLTRGESKYSVGQHYNPGDIKVSPTNPAGVNLGAVLMAIASINPYFFTTRFKDDGDESMGTKVILGEWGNYTEWSVYVWLENLKKDMSSGDGHRWPDAIAWALVFIKWPENPGGGLASTPVKDALRAELEDFAQTVYRSYAQMNTPIVLTTNSITSYPGLKPKYAYALLGGTGTQMWLGDPAAEGENRLYTLSQDVIKDFAYSYVLTKSLPSTTLPG